MDPYVGKDTEFNTFNGENTHGNIKTLKLMERGQGSRFFARDRSKNNIFIQSPLNVPFGRKPLITETWHFEMKRIATESHIVQVTSRPKNVKDQLRIRLFTNAQNHSVAISSQNPLILYAEVKSHCSPVSNADVQAHIRVLQPSGVWKNDLLKVDLLDNGAGGKSLLIVSHNYCISNCVSS